MKVRKMIYMMGYIQVVSLMHNILSKLLSSTFLTAKEGTHRHQLTHLLHVYQFLSTTLLCGKRNRFWYGFVLPLFTMTTSHGQLHPVRLVAPSCRLVTNAVGLVTQIVHYVHWLCYCCVSYPCRVCAISVQSCSQTGLYSLGIIQ